MSRCWSPGCANSPTSAAVPPTECCPTPTICGSTPRTRSRCWRTADWAHPNRLAGTSGFGSPCFGCPGTPNPPDGGALACEPGVLVRWVREPADLADVDVVVVPGTKSTVADLGWMRERGLDQAIRQHAASGRAVLGICGG